MNIAESVPFIPGWKKLLAVAVAIPVLFGFLAVVGVVGGGGLANIAFFTAEAEIYGLVMVPLTALMTHRWVKIRSVWWWGWAFLGIHFALSLPVLFAAFGLGLLRLEGP